MGIYQPVAGSGMGGKDSANQENGYRPRFSCVHCAWVQHLSPRKDSAGNFQWLIIISAIHAEFGGLSATYAEKRGLSLILSQSEDFSDRRAFQNTSFG
jgi:hypothetical protein